MRRLDARLLGVLLAAAAVRLLVLLHTPGYRPFGDPADYFNHALWINYFHRFPTTSWAAPGTPTALRPPAYPLMLAGLLRLIGPHFTPMRLADLALGVASVWLVFLVARRAFGAPVAYWSALVAALFPPMVWLCASLLSENLFVPLLLGAVYLLMRWHERRRLGTAALLGTVIGAAVMTRGNGVWLIIPAVVSIGLVGRRHPGAAARSVLALSVAFLAFLAPWTVRNEDAFGGLLPLGTQTGYTLAGAYNFEAQGAGPLQAAWRVPQTVSDFAPLLAHPTLDESALDPLLRDRAVSFAEAHPGYVARVVELNALRLLDLGPGHSFVGGLSYREMGVPADSTTVLRAGLYAVLALAVLGLLAHALGRPRDRRWEVRPPRWFWSVPLLMLASVVFILGAPRYRAPADPYIAMLAGCSLTAVADRIRARRKPS